LFFLYYQSNNDVVDICSLVLGLIDYDYYNVIVNTNEVKERKRETLHIFFAPHLNLPCKKYRGVYREVRIERVR
jgi:hypothetical protein